VLGFQREYRIHKRTLRRWLDFGASALVMALILFIVLFY